MSREVAKPSVAAPTADAATVHVAANVATSKDAIPLVVVPTIGTPSF